MNLIDKPFEKKRARQVLIVTGLSGAGKSVIMRSLEDLGFYCIDNLPVPLLSTFLKFAFASHTSFLKVALGIDARGDGFFEDFMKEVDYLRGMEDNLCQIKIIFVYSSDHVLVKRFQETRRTHPLANDISVVDAIRKEKKLFSPIRELADITLDTDNLNIHELRKWVSRTFSDVVNREIIVHLVSFGFKYGIPPESNMIYDLRFLPNPHFIPSLKSLDGRSSPIQEYLFSKAPVIEYWDHLNKFLSFCVQKYFEEGRYFVTIAIGCTGGKHRSVSFVERLGKSKWQNVRFLIHHRDVNKEVDTSYGGIEHHTSLRAGELG